MRGINCLPPMTTKQQSKFSSSLVLVHNFIHSHRKYDSYVHELQTKYALYMSDPTEASLENLFQISPPLLRTLECYHHAYQMRYIEYFEGPESDTESDTEGI